jgi:F-type H+-transporting ATPase subunit delta
MIDRRLANRYAEALFLSARDADEVDRVGEELVAVADGVAESVELRRLLLHPEIRLERKLAVLRQALPETYSERGFSFLRVLLEAGRIEALPAAAEQYQVLTDQWRGIVRAQVTTAVPLTDDERARLEAALGRKEGGRVALEVMVDPSILAGMIVRLRDRVIDGSARTRLQRMRERLVPAGITSRAGA